MMNIQEKGKLDEWCSDSIQWLQATFGKDNMVAAHLHMDEKTPHIHAAVVPIVTGERRKAKKEQTDGKRNTARKQIPSVCVPMTCSTVRPWSPTTTITQG